MKSQVIDLEGPAATRIRHSGLTGDRAAIAAVNLAAFGKPGTPAFDDLRAKAPGAADILSLVAESDGGIVGHVFFSPVTIDGPSGPVNGMGLGELAVHPGLQRRGIGAALTRAGLDVLANNGCPFVIVIGVPEYYPRFGFEPGVRHRLQCQWDGIPDDSFMVRILDSTVMASASGTARYRDV